LLHAEAAATHQAALRQEAPALTPLTRMVALPGAALPAAWYLAALPGLSIVLTVLSLNLLGDALNDAFNPRLAG
jgi:ABC-type dipeptide/oligopeptide/nickel transport system permease subunit